MALGLVICANASFGQLTLFWTEATASGGGVIRSRPVAGGAVTDVATAPTQFNGIDFTAGSLVVTGGPATSVTAVNPVGVPFVFEAAGGYDTTLSGGVTYFTDGSSSRVRTNTDGTYGTLLTNDRFTYGIKIYNNQIYFSELGSSSGGSINRMNLDGTGLVTLIDNVRVYDFEIYGDQIYYGLLDFPGGIRRANLDGTGSTLLLGNFTFAYGLEVDATGIYWATYPVEIYRANLDGSNPTTLLTGLNAVRGVTLVEISPATVPEPSTLMMLAFANATFVAAAIGRRRTRGN